MNEIVRYSSDQMVLIKRTVAQGATDDELNLFIYDCQRRNIHPLDRLLHFTKRGGRYVPITSIDLMRSRAAETGQMAGSDDALFGPCDSDHDKPLVATVTVYRMTNGQRFPYTATARWGEYYPGDGPGGAMWRKMPFVMLAKCAEALALRKAFPQELAGLYAKEEMDQAEGPVQRPPPKIGPNVIQTITKENGKTVYEHIPATLLPDAADHVTVPQQEPAAASADGHPRGGGLPLDREAFRAGVEAAQAPMPPIATEAFQVAQKGLQEYERWWINLSKSERKQLLPYHEMIKGAAAEADNQE